MNLNYSINQIWERN